MFRKWGEGWVSSGETGGPGPAIHRRGTDTDFPPPALSVRAVPGRLRKKKTPQAGGRNPFERGILSVCRGEEGGRASQPVELFAFSTFYGFVIP